MTTTMGTVTFGLNVLLVLLFMSTVDGQLGSEDVILFVNRTYIHTVRVDNSSHHIIPLQNLKKAKYVDYDPFENRIYWSDISNGIISRAGYCGNDQETIINTTKRALVSIAVDSINKKIYWTDPTYDKIERANLDGSNPKTIASYSMSFPRDIAVDSTNKFVYWLDSGTKPKIERCKTDGARREVIIDMRDSYPSALALDITKQKIYWNDNKKKQLLEANTDGSGMRVLATGKFPLMTGLSILDNYLYWPDFYGNTIERVNRYTGLDRKDVFGKESDMEDLTVVRVRKSVTSCPPAPPTNFETIQVSNTSASFSWSNGYGWGLDQILYIEEKLPDGRWTGVATIPSQKKELMFYNVQGLRPKQEYILRLFSCNSHGCREDDGPNVTLTTEGAPTVSSSFLSYDITDRSINVTWTSGYNGGKEQTFKIEQREINAGTYWTVVGIMSDPGRGTRMKYSIKNLRAKTEYAFRLLTCNIYGCSLDGPVRRKTLGPPSLPVNFKMKYATNTTMVLQWTSRYDGGSTQTFYLEQKQKLQWKGIARLLDSDQSNRKHQFRISGLKPRTMYKFRLYSCNRFGCTRQNKRLESFLTLGPPASPVFFRQAEVNRSSIMLSWKSGDNGGVSQTFYLQQDCVCNDNNWTTIANVSDDTESPMFWYTVETLTPDTMYQFRLFTCNTFGCLYNDSLILNIKTKGDVDQLSSDISHRNGTSSSEISNLQPPMIIIIAVVASLVAVFIVVVIVVKCTRKGNNSKVPGKVKYSGVNV